MPAAYLRTAAGLNGRIVVIDIIKLDLHEFELRVFGKYRFQHLRFIVEGNAQMPYFPLAAQLYRLFIGAAALEMLVPFAVLCVHQIEIEIVHAHYFELAFEEGAHLGFIPEIVAGELVGKHEGIPRVAVHNAFAHCDFAFAAQITVGGIEIIEARRNEFIRHPAEFGIVDRFALHRKAHTPEAEVLFHIFKARHYIHLR